MQGSSTTLDFSKLDIEILELKDLLKDQIAQNKGDDLIKLKIEEKDFCFSLSNPYNLPRPDQFSYRANPTVYFANIEAFKLIYDFFKVPILDARYIYSSERKQYYIAQEIKPGELLGDFEKKESVENIKKVHDKIRQDIAYDMFCNNQNVVGNGILVTSDGTPWRMNLTFCSFAEERKDTMGFSILSFSEMFRFFLKQNIAANDKNVILISVKDRNLRDSVKKITQFFDKDENKIFFSEKHQFLQNFKKEILDRARLFYSRFNSVIEPRPPLEDRYFIQTTLDKMKGSRNYSISTLLSLTHKPKLIKEIQKEISTIPGLRPLDEQSLEAEKLKQSLEKQQLDDLTECIDNITGRKNIEDFVSNINILSQYRTFGYDLNLFVKTLKLISHDSDKQKAKNLLKTQMLEIKQKHSDFFYNNDIATSFRNAMSLFRLSRFNSYSLDDILNIKILKKSIDDKQYQELKLIVCNMVGNMNKEEGLDTFANSINQIKKLNECDLLGRSLHNIFLHLQNICINTACILQTEELLDKSNEINQNQIQDQSEKKQNTASFVDQYPTKQQSSANNTMEK